MDRKQSTPIRKLKSRALGIGFAQYCQLGTVNCSDRSFPLLPYLRLFLPTIPMANFDFFITRIGDAADPAARLEFYPPIGSDELHDALKRAYPHLPSLQARMREAVIEFYLTEQDPFRQLLHYTPDTTMNVSPSNLSSNESSFVSTAYTPPAMESTPSSSEVTSSSTPSQQDLMNVWTLPTSTQTKIHKRRNMTADEKIKYKAKRLAGACNDCRRRRRRVRTESGFLFSVTRLRFLYQSSFNILLFQSSV